MIDLILLGAGGHAKDVLKNIEEYNQDSPKSRRFNVVGCVDDVSGRKRADVMGYEIFNSTEILLKKPFRNARLLCAVGDPVNRINFLKKLPMKNPRFATLVHPSVRIDGSVEIGPGTVIFAGSIVSACCVIGSNVCVNYLCSISHDCSIGDNVVICPGARIGGRVAIGDNALLGINCCCANDITIGSWSAVGAGTVVIKDVPGHAITVGNPGRIAGKRKENVPLL